MGTTLVSVIGVAVLFALFGLARRGRDCDGTCAACGDECPRRVTPGRHLKEVSRGET